MNIETKYRIWIASEQEMYYGESGKGITIKEIAEQSISANLYHDNGLIDDLLWLKFTGLKDRDGNDIYEGDIVEYPWSDFKEDHIEIGDIRWWKDRWGVCMDSGQNAHSLGDRPLTLEVIGNIHENPELLSQ